MFSSQSTLLYSFSMASSSWSVGKLSLAVTSFSMVNSSSMNGQLIFINHDILPSLNSFVQTNMIAMDFLKAFDRVSHQKLIHKLHYFGIQGETSIGSETSCLAQLCVLFWMGRN